jgi:hypothetical protein
MRAGLVRPAAAIFVMRPIWFAYTCKGYGFLTLEKLRGWGRGKVFPTPGPQERSIPDMGNLTCLLDNLNG